MMSYERMDRLGILLDAEWETERIEREKREGKQKKPVPRTVYTISSGWVHETKIGHKKAISKAIINLKQAMGRYKATYPHQYGGGKQ